MSNRVGQKKVEEDLEHKLLSRSRLLQRLLLLGMEIFEERRVLHMSLNMSSMLSSFACLQDFP